MKIADNSVVTLEYSLHLGDGVIVDHSEPEDPLIYLHGMGEIVPGLEAALEDLEAGASVQIVVDATDGYGLRDEEAVQTLALSAFGEQKLTEGDEFIASDDDGEAVPVKVLKVFGDKVTVDFNHPLAGKTLHFSVQVRAVRAATEEELEHGHFHGEGDGHHHDD